MRRGWIVAGAIVMLMTIFNFVLPNKVYACICGFNDTSVEEASAKADAIFVGKVIGITGGRDYSSTLVPEGIAFEDITFEVRGFGRGYRNLRLLLERFQ